MAVVMEGAAMAVAVKFPSFRIIRKSFRASRAFRSFSVSASASASAPPSVNSLGHSTRPNFPILDQEVNGSKLVYLDNAATSQKPTAVLRAIQTYYEAYNSNAGTPAIGEAVGLGAAIYYLSAISMQKIHDYENVRRAALCSFNVENIHPMDIATFLDQQVGSPLRSTPPLQFRNSASARVGLHLYNTKEDVDYFIQALNDTVSFFNSFN